MSKLLNIAEVMEMFNIRGRSTVYRWVKEGNLPEPIETRNCSPLWSEEEIERRLLNPTREEKKRKLPEVVAGRPFSELQDAIGKPLRSFTGSDLIAMRQPLIYAWVRDGEVLYIGKSVWGMQRPLDAGHHRLKDILPTDQLYIWHLQTAVEVERIERQLIVLLKPRYNKPVHCEQQAT